jgi:hypothetical protein
MLFRTKYFKSESAFRTTSRGDSGLNLAVFVFKVAGEQRDENR